MSGLKYSFWKMRLVSTNRLVARVLVGKVLKVALPALIADRAIQRMIGQDEFEHRLMGVVDDRRGGPNAMPSVGQGAAGGLKFGIFSISTRHMRQLASGLSFGW